MNSWRFNSVVKDFASDESLSTAVASGKDQTGSMGWEGNMGLIPNQINIDNQVSGEMGFPSFMKNSVFNPIMTLSQNAFSEESESNYGIKSISKESGLIDLKLGRLIDQEKAQILNPPKIAHNLSQYEVSILPKRRSFGPSTPVCKVYGCNKSLSNCKEYHKRNKVCEVHSKTSKAIVNGIEQRFCQQCSRFHLLTEFDDGKRSCRKRLAGHNERRRKPHVGTRRLLPSYNISVQVNQFKGSTSAISSFTIPNDLASPYNQKYDTNGRWEMNLEDERAHDLQSISCINTVEQICAKSFSPCNFETHPRVVNGCIRASVSSSESAHSLLSSQSGTTSSHSPRIQTSNSQPQHMLFPGSHFEPTQDFVQLHQHDLNPMLGFEGSLIKYGVMNSDDQVFPEEGCTIDLLCLSSQLERVEHQKGNSQVNPANGVSVGLGIT